MVYVLPRQTVWFGDPVRKGSDVTEFRGKEYTTILRKTVACRKKMVEVNADGQIVPAKSTVVIKKRGRPDKVFKRCFSIG